MAVLDRASLTSAANADFADNTTRQITPIRLRTFLKNVLDSFYNKTSDSVAIGYSGIHSLNVGDNTITHNLGKTARFVGFRDEEGNVLSFQWEVNNTNSINVISSESYEDITINIIGF